MILFDFPCYYEDGEGLSHFSRDYNIREAVVTSSQAKGKMRDTTSGANDALADLPKLLQEGGTVSRLQCGLRTSLSARVVEDRNSYVSGATWGLTSSFRDFKARGRGAHQDQGQERECKRSQRGALQSPDHPQHRQGQGEEPVATSKMILGLVQSKMPRRFLKFQPCDAVVS